jgi:hypothetical protein
MILARNLSVIQLLDLRAARTRIAQDRTNSHNREITVHLEFQQQPGPNKQIAD